VNIQLCSRPRIEQADIDAIRDRVSVVDLIAKHVSDMKDCGGGRHIARCPFHDERTPSFAIWPDHFHCYGCGAHGDVIEAAMRLGKLSFLAAVDRLRRDAGIDRALSAEEQQEIERQRRERERKAAATAAAKLRAAKRIIRECCPSAGSGVITYLTARGLPLPRPIKDLLFHASLQQWEPDPRNPKRMESVARWPAMVGVVRDKAGAVVGAHRTYLDRDCKRKAPIDRPKRMLGDCAGGAVRLGPPATKMGACEGIETGTALLEQWGIPVWAGLNTSGLGAMELPDMPMGREPIIGADNDRNGAGENAARKAMARWIGESRRPQLVMPDAIDTDWADVVALKRGLGAAA
jgi:hypothetical protein